MRDEGRSDGTHRGWLRFQFSYCNETALPLTAAVAITYPRSPVTALCSGSCAGLILLIIPLHIGLGSLQMSKDGACVQLKNEVPVRDAMAI